MRVLIDCVADKTPLSRFLLLTLRVKTGRKRIRPGRTILLRYMHMPGNLQNTIFLRQTYPEFRLG